MLIGCGVFAFPVFSLPLLLVHPFAAIFVIFKFTRENPPLPLPTRTTNALKRLGSKAIAEDLEDGDGLLQLGDLRIFSSCEGRKGVYSWQSCEGALFWDGENVTLYQVK